jgi:hypothetical protein
MADEQTPEERALEVLSTLQFLRWVRSGNPQAITFLTSAFSAAEERGAAREREACAALAENPYGDEVYSFGSDEPKAVGRKIANAIRARSEKGEGE